MFLVSLMVIEVLNVDFISLPNFEFGTKFQREWILMTTIDQYCNQFGDHERIPSPPPKKKKP